MSYKRVHLDNIFVQYVCLIFADIQVKWADLEFSSFVKIHQNGTLILEEVSTADGGQYSCEADNGMAPSATFSFFVTVNGNATDSMYISKSSINKNVMFRKNSIRQNNFSTLLMNKTYEKAFYRIELTLSMWKPRITNAFL